MPLVYREISEIKTALKIVVLYFPYLVGLKMAVYLAVFLPLVYRDD